MTVRTRIEPSPSGSLHVGNALTAEFNWLYARRHAGAFVLRIADTDKARVTEEGIRSALEDLRWLGLEWDEGPEVGGAHEPYFQSQRGELYREAADRLLAGGHAYRCYCTPEELEAKRALAKAEKRPYRYDRRCRTLTADERAAFEAEGRPAVVRVAVPDGATTITDLVRGEHTFEHEQIEDFVILRADGSALYNLCVSYDDMTMGMTHVIRGEDIFASTPKQVLLMQAWGYESIPAYGHLPLIVGPDRQKLSKRHGDTSVISYREKGFLPESLINYLAIINWSIGDGTTERFTVEELIEAFDPSGITRNPSAFDLEKLTALNGEKIRDLSHEDFVERCIPYLIASGVLVEPVSDYDRGVLMTMAPLVQERTKRLDEVPGQLRFLFHVVEPDDKASGMLTAEHAPTLEAALKILETVEPWEPEPIQEAMIGWADGAGLKRKTAFQPVRAAVCGTLISPPLFESIAVLGREFAVERVRNALTRARA